MAYIFARFSELPPELRNQIWRQALPDLTEPGLCLYKKGCWQPRYLIPSDPDYLEGDLDNIRYEFRHDMLTMPVELPQFFANREARSIILDWIRNNDVEIRYSEDRIHFVRRLNSKVDALYVPMEKLLEFDMEPVDRQFEPDLVGRTVGIATHLTRFALSAEFFYSEELLPEVWELFTRVEVLYVVVGEHPDMQGQWDIQQTGRAIFWNDEVEKFELQDGDDIYDGRLYHQILDDSKGLGKVLKENAMSKFKIQPVSAARR
ncbi:hypothetical protein F66182_7236 [Fusarium sp. NRRL 66182]|nr:hypothetical protein F66182_7236 [Fusarium sp. NRRL 66182]